MKTIPKRTNGDAETNSDAEANGTVMSEAEASEQ